MGQRPRMNRKAYQTIRVALGTRSYPIVFGPGLLTDIGKLVIQRVSPGKVGLITDKSVDAFYGKKATRSLQAAGFEVVKILLPPGEKTKTLRWVQGILDRLVREKFERGSGLVALGGGVIGDITGFAASIYVRGIPFIQVPTTLIAQVDSSVGGKTGVNHSLGKNLIGSFYQPHQVLIDPVTLRTLPRRELIAGLAEVVKYGVIADQRLFRFVERNTSGLVRMDPTILLHIIRRSCQIKASVVGEDEREHDRRRILNYGHTIGHAIEAWGRYRTFVHGEAVAIGMVMEAELSHFLGFCSKEVVDRQRRLLGQIGLASRLPRVRGTVLWDLMMRDKKVVRQQVYCVLPRDIGSVTIAPLQKSEFLKWYNRKVLSS